MTMTTTSDPFNQKREGDGGGDHDDAHSFLFSKTEGLVVISIHTFALLGKGMVVTMARYLVHKQPLIHGVLHAQQVHHHRGA